MTAEKALMYPKQIPVRASLVEALREGLKIEVEEKTYFIPWGECSASLASATEIERLAIQVSPMGIGIHWPLLDEDLAVGPLVRGRMASA